MTPWVWHLVEMRTRAAGFSQRGADKRGVICFPLRNPLFVSIGNAARRFPADFSARTYGSQDLNEWYDRQLYTLNSETFERCRLVTQSSTAWLRDLSSRTVILFSQPTDDRVDHIRRFVCSPANEVANPHQPRKLTRRKRGRRCPCFRVRFEIRNHAG